MNLNTFFHQRQNIFCILIKMYFSWKMILFYLPLLLFLYMITLTIWSWTSIIPTCSNSLSLSPSLLDNLETLPDSRVRLSKLIGKSRLGPISMWVAFPSSEEIVPGAAWYDQLWNKNKFGGYEYIDDIISVSPCENYDKIFIQIGAHLGIFPLVAAYRGCRAIAVEPMPAAINFTRISAKLNNWGEDKFIAINAVGSNKSGGFMLFDTRTMSVSENSANMKRKLPIPMITLDALNDNYGSTQGRSESSIKFVIVDVEGHEQEVLLGGKKLIEQRSVLVFEIEVWSVQPKTGLVRSFPGLELLVDNGYRLYTRTSNLNMGFKPCDELTNRLSEIPRIFNRTCQMPDYPKSRCLNEVFAIRNDVLPFHTWYSSCSRRTNN